MSEECLEAAKKRNALAKALKTKIDESLYEELLEIIRTKKEHREKP